jgi:hypothetical protein
MNRDKLSEEQQNVVWRYLKVWRRFRRLPEEHRSFVKLEDDLAQGSGMLLCGILIDLEAAAVITADVKDPKFFAAMFENADSAVPDMTPDELKQARRYVIHGEGTVWS